MRVGLRRLRAAISLFSKLFGDKQTERIKSELNWLKRENFRPRETSMSTREARSNRCAAPHQRRGE